MEWKQNRAPYGIVRAWDFRIMDCVTGKTAQTKTIAEEPEYGGRVKRTEDVDESCAKGKCEWSNLRYKYAEKMYNAVCK